MYIVPVVILVALLLLWGGILALLKWVHPLEDKHFLGLGAYASVLSAALIFLVLKTSLTQQQNALENTQTRLNQELNLFRDKLGQQTERIMSQLTEKAELTQSEMEVRGLLQTERAQHAKSREDLTAMQKQLKERATQLAFEQAAHGAYLDSLNTERATHASTRVRLDEAMQNGVQDKRDLQTSLTNLQQAQTAFQETQKDLRQVRQALEQTQQALGQSKELLAVKSSETEKLLAQNRESENRLQEARNGMVTALKQELAQQQRSLSLLQAAVDSIYEKVLKKPRTETP
jgi:septal ring factor EnvC (AmiA/AmiB activator)